ncbi:MAG: glycosyltransferase family 39 protein, partial [Phycisphaerae bacterium]
MTNNNGEPPADHPPAAFRSTGRLAAVGLTAVLTLAAVLRIYGLGDEAYWLDEMHSLADSAARRAEFEALRTGVILDAVPRSTDLTPDSTLAAVWRGMEADSHPPLYFEALLLWRRLFGDGEAAVRTLSVIFSLLSLVPVALILRGPHPWLGLAVAAALALSFSHIHIAQENRPYALGLLLISVSYWALVRMQTGWSRWDRNRRQAGALLYGVAIYLSMLTHYFAALALLGQVVLILGLSQRPLRRAWILTVAAATLAFALTWGRQLIGQCEFIAHQPWLLDLHPNHAWATLLRLTDLPLRLLFARERFQLNYYLSFLGAVILIAALFTLWRARRRGALLFAAWYLTPVLGLTLLDLITGKQLLSHIRYAAVAVPGLVGLIVLAADSIGRVAARVIAAAFLAVALLSHQLPTQENPRARQAAARI